ncbi:hypothetical protein [Streptomyces europaeiscabiei]|uniref:hypothetical protein n=1 Tax=Streptomyces europaeiscabiei TaxID=146819 RepID=UPI0029B15CB0|nr:hypothetical protein [Streptomyces europaeiscabiei]MDX2528036.1 hypothetical protein [Streptomyces europaeiscabiei]MDX3713394.1 hypothetical protein [Streptomyces europaeiscabiei]
MLTACDHSQTQITTEPQISRLQGDRTTVDLSIALTANCPHGHRRTLYVNDISAMPDACRQLAEWAEGHVNNCSGA